MKKLLKKISADDAFFFLGLCLIWYGSFCLNKPISFILIGLAFVFIGIKATRQTKGGDK
jgi:hypothetical protein